MIKSCDELVSEPAQGLCLALGANSFLAKRVMGVTFSSQPHTHSQPLPRPLVPWWFCTSDRRVNCFSITDGIHRVMCLCFRVIFPASVRNRYMVACYVERAISAKGDSKAGYNRSHGDLKMMQGGLNKIQESPEAFDGVTIA